MALRCARGQTGTVRHASFTPHCDIHDTHGVSVVILSLLRGKYNANWAFCATQSLRVNVRRYRLGCLVKPRSFKYFVFFLSFFPLETGGSRHRENLLRMELVKFTKDPGSWPGTGEARKCMHLLLSDVLILG